MMVAVWCALLLRVTPVMHGVDGEAVLDAPVLVSLRSGVLELRSQGGTVRYGSSPEMQVVGWAPFTFAGERSLLVWFLRRDANERGVVAHDSGWMSYGETPWLNHHIALLSGEGPLIAARWVSSGLMTDAVWVEPPSSVLLRREERLERYQFRGWSLARVSSAGAVAGAALDSGLVDIISVGDVMVGRGTARGLDVIGSEAAFKEVRPLFLQADLRLGNLESCFSVSEPQREGPRHFYAPLRHLAALRHLKFDGLSVANNHCGDEDAEFSREMLSRAGISTLQHWQSVRFERQGVSVEVIGVRALPGESAEHMNEVNGAFLRSLSADLIIVSVHWGIEFSVTPSQEQHAFAAWLQRHGVAVVLGHHPHVVQPIVSSAAGVVAFSQGNFVFDQEGARGIPSGATTERGEVVELRYHRVLGLTVRSIATTIERRAEVHFAPIERRAK